MAKREGKPNELPRTFVEASRYFSDLDVATEYVAKLRWPDGPVCPKCEGKEHSYISTRRLWQCRACRKQFSVKVGTIFEDSPIPLDKWLLAMWELANDKNGISSYELAGKIGITQKSAWFVLHRIRLAMQAGTFEKFSEKFDGAVEVDETYIGGKARNMHASRRARVRRELGRAQGHFGKTGVVGFLERGGEVRTQVLSQGLRKEQMHRRVRDHVKPGATLITDELKSYSGLDQHYQHQIISHADRYVDGQVHTNGLENFWSLLKRSLRGTYVSVRPFHLFRYLDEQAFRYNTRENDHAGRVWDVLQKVEGRRVTWKELTGKTRDSEPMRPLARKPRAFPMGPF